MIAELHGEAPSTEAMEAGLGFREEVAVRVIEKLGPLRKVKTESVYDMMAVSRANIKAALESRIVLANSEEHILVWAISPELRFIGVPDKIDCSNGKDAVIMDFKTTGRLPSDAWADHRIQTGAYMLGVERLGFAQSHGIVRYVSRLNVKDTADFKVYMDDYLREQVRTTASQVHGILDGAEFKPTTNPNKCKNCGYHSVCEWTPLTNQT